MKIFNIFTVILLTFFSLSGYAQKILENKDGSTEIFQDIHEENGRIYIRKMNQSVPQELNKSQVVGYYDQNKEIYYYFIAGQFMEKVLEGSIDGYTRTETEVIALPTGSEYNTTVYLYLDKAGNFFETLDVSEAKAFGKLREIFSDDEEIMGELSSMSSIKYKQIYTLVKSII